MLRLFQVHAVTEGTDAQAQVSVRLEEGGRRLLVLPPELAYGAQSPSPDIAANETLVFVVDLEKVG